MDFQLGGLEIVFKGCCCHSWGSVACPLCFLPQNHRLPEREIIKLAYIMVKQYKNSDCWKTGRFHALKWQPFCSRCNALRTACVPYWSSLRAPRLQSRTSLSLTISQRPFLFRWTPSCTWEFTCVLWSFSQLQLPNFHTECPFAKYDAFNKPRIYYFSSGNIFKSEFHRVY